MPNLMRRATVALTGVAIVANVLAAGGPALAASSPQAEAFESGNWAGYYTVADAPIHGATGLFTVPSVSCRNSRGVKPYYGSMWVGIGGMGSTGNSIDPGGPAWLEQAGVNVTCSSLNAKPQYELFWEVVPAPGEGNPCSSGYDGSFGNAHVQAGDSVRVMIDPPTRSPKPGYWYFWVAASSSSVPWEKYVKLPNGVYTGQTVEVITEYPTAVNNACRAIPSGFVDLGTVHYTNAVYLAGGLQTGISMLTNRIDLYHNGSLAVSPGEPYTSETSSADNDSFNTYYAKNWWR